jgi:hypothetical protein
LKILILKKNPLGNAGIEKIAWGVRHINCKIDNLDITECEFEHKGANSLFLAIS